MQILTGRGEVSVDVAATVKVVGVGRVWAPVVGVLVEDVGCWGVCALDAAYAVVQIASSSCYTRRIVRDFSLVPLRTQHLLLRRSRRYACVCCDICNSLFKSALRHAEDIYQ